MSLQSIMNKNKQNIQFTIDKILYIVYNANRKTKQRRIGYDNL